MSDRSSDDEEPTGDDAPTEDAVEAGTDEGENAGNGGAGDAEEVETGDAPDDAADAEEPDPSEAPESGDEAAQAGADEEPEDAEGDPLGAGVEDDTDADDGGVAEDAAADDEDEVTASTATEATLSTASTGTTASTDSAGDDDGFFGGNPPAPDEEKSPGIAALASVIVPGAGQAYNGQFQRGIVVFALAAVGFVVYFFVVTILTIFTLGLGSVLFLLWPVVHFVAAYDAYLGAQKANEARTTAMGE